MSIESLVFPDFPVVSLFPALKEGLAQSNRLVLQAAPGAGKSTLVPLALLKEPWLGSQKILMLEPRRLAAKGVAQRMADLLGESLGETVGYRIRFESKVGPQTRIEVITEGILSRMLLEDNALEDVGLLIFDEFHERSLPSDLGLALALESQSVLRDDLRILVMSATLDAQGLAQKLGGCPYLVSEGRQYPVSEIYEAPDPGRPWLSELTRLVLRACREQTRGDVLVFLPGVGEIRKVTLDLEERLEDSVWLVFPLYGELEASAQQAALRPSPAGKRKVVLATSIAETSLTLPGVTTVVDAGLMRKSVLDPRTGMNTLQTVPITQDAAEQRKGRAGRLEPGVVYRLWPAHKQIQLEPRRLPEIVESDLAPLRLDLAAWGIHRAEELFWLDAPPAQAWATAGQLLDLLKLTEEGKITPLGKQAARLPTHPRYAAMMLQAGPQQALAADLLALLEEKDLLDRQTSADISLRLELLHRFRQGIPTQAERGRLERIERLAKEWKRQRNLDKSPRTSVQDLHEAGKLLALAFPDRLARRREGSERVYKLANGRSAALEANDPLSAEEFLVLVQADPSAGKEGRIFLAAPLDTSDLMALAEEAPALYWDYGADKLMSVWQKRVGDLVLASRLNPQPDAAAVQELLCQVLRKEGLHRLNWADGAEQWCFRVRSLATWFPEQDWPDVHPEALADTLELWLAPYLTSVKRLEDFAKIPLMEALAQLLDYARQQEVERLAPQTLKVPSGSDIRLEYRSEGEAPILAARIQELFGLKETPKVAQGRVGVLLHLLSPGYKPIQVTQDLYSFWTNTYPEVRKELKIRYPRHFWPEDPWTAEAVRGVKRKTS